MGKLLQKGAKVLHASYDKLELAIDGKSLIFYRDWHDNLYYMEFKPQMESLMTSSTGEDGKTDDADYHGDTNDDDPEGEDDEPEDLQAAKK